MEFIFWHSFVCSCFSASLLTHQICKFHKGVTRSKCSNAENEKNVTTIFARFNAINATYQPQLLTMWLSCPSISLYPATGLDG